MRMRLQIPFAFCTWIFILLTLLILSAYGQDLSCGIVGADPSETIELGPMPDHWASGVQIWIHETFNVKNTTVVSHPHTKYVDGLKYTSKYALRTSAHYAGFLQTEQTSKILRTVNFYCNDEDNTVVTYGFEILVEISDKKQPEFFEPQYAFGIPSDWPPSVSINQGQYILVKDEDEDFVNSDLTMSTTTSRPEEFTAVATKLWPEGYTPEVFTYRVDIYLKDGSVVPPPGNYEFQIIAASRFNSGDAHVKLQVV